MGQTFRLLGLREADRMRLRQFASRRTSATKACSRTSFAASQHVGGRGAGARHLGEPDQRRLVLGFERVGLAPDLRGIPGGRMSKTVLDRRQHGFLGLDRQRRPHRAARPAASQGQSFWPSRVSTGIAAVGISNTATGLQARVWPGACCSAWSGCTDEFRGGCCASWTILPSKPV